MYNRSFVPLSTITGAICGTETVCHYGAPIEITSVFSGVRGVDLQVSVQYVEEHCLSYYPFCCHYIVSPYSIYVSDYAFGFFIFSLITVMYLLLLTNNNNVMLISHNELVGNREDWHASEHRIHNIN